MIRLPIFQKGSSLKSHPDETIQFEGMRGRFSEDWREG